MTKQNASCFFYSLHFLTNWNPFYLTNIQLCVLTPHLLKLPFFHFTLLPPFLPSLKNIYGHLTISSPLQRGKCVWQKRTRIYLSLHVWLDIYINNCHALCIDKKHFSLDGLETVSMGVLVDINTNGEALSYELFLETKHSSPIYDECWTKRLRKKCKKTRWIGDLLHKFLKSGPPMVNRFQMPGVDGSR